MNSYTNTIWYANESKSGNNVGISLQGGANCSLVNNIAVIDTSWPDWSGKPLSIADLEGTITVSSNVIWGIGNYSLSLDTDLDGIEENTIIGNPKFISDIAYDDYTLNNGDIFRVEDDSAAANAANYGYLACEDYYQNYRPNLTIGAAGYGSDHIFNALGGFYSDINGSYLDECYSWIYNYSLDSGSDEDDRITIISLAIADGLVKWWDDYFRGMLDYLDVKHPTGSDLRETHLRFEAPTDEWIYNRTDCNRNNDDAIITDIELWIKSTGDDQDLTEDIQVYLAFGNWNESQNTTNNVPTTSDGELIGSVPMDVATDEWLSILLNVSILEANGYTDSDTFELIVSATYDSRVLEFYARESGYNNTARIEIKVECSIGGNAEGTTSTTALSSTHTTMEYRSTLSTITDTIIDSTNEMTSVTTATIAPTVSQSISTKNPTVDIDATAVSAPTVTPVENMSDGYGRGILLARLQLYLIGQIIAVAFGLKL